MGGNLSTTSSATGTTSAAMPSSDSPPTHESKPQSEPTHDPNPPETQAKLEESSDHPIPSEVKQDDAVSAAAEEEEDEEEEGECGFCLYMKGGDCRDAFIEWENCVLEGEQNKEDVVEKCFEISSNLIKCMKAHPDYYGPLLSAEKAAQEELEQQNEIQKGIQESAEEKDGVLNVSQKNSEGKDGVLGGSEGKKEEGS
ncbi:hypothetical protein ACH5RR_030499 [Cinchona calisaya]|uniref:GCK domain-containing protein n=1 Tax=Cinchona calisaya TaxID=153742 RepID=A0ABD2YZY5_9GENT